MKKNPKAPWFIDPGFSKEQDGLDPGGVLYCPECDIIWQLNGARSCLKCNCNLTVCLPSYPPISNRTLIYRIYCREHGQLTAAEAKFIQVKKGMPHEGQRFGLHCKHCGQPAHPAARRLGDVNKPWPDGFPADPPSDVPEQEDPLYRCAQCNRTWWSLPVTAAGPLNSCPDCGGGPIEAVPRHTL